MYAFSTPSSLEKINAMQRIISVDLVWDPLEIVFLITLLFGPFDDLPMPVMNAEQEAMESLAKTEIAREEVE